MAKEKLKGIPAPKELRYLLQWFLEFSWGRGEQCTWGDVADWARVMNRRPLPYESMALLRMASAADRGSRGSEKH